jgi:hypothetical protein
MPMVVYSPWVTERFDVDVKLLSSAGVFYIYWLTQNSEYFQDTTLTWLTWIIITTFQITGHIQYGCVVGCHGNLHKYSVAL